MQFDTYDADLSRALGGIPARGTVLVTGAAATGKSSLIARLLRAVALAPTPGAIHWLDRDRTPEGALAFLKRAGVQVGRFPRLVVRDTGTVRVVPADAAALAMLTLEEWATSVQEREALLRDVFAHPARVKVVELRTRTLPMMMQAIRTERDGSRIAVVNVRQGGMPVSIRGWGES
jgi:hypothetical protein